MSIVNFTPDNSAAAQDIINAWETKKSVGLGRYVASIAISAAYISAIFWAIDAMGGSLGYGAFEWACMVWATVPCFWLNLAWRSIFPKRSTWFFGGETALLLNFAKVLFAIFWPFLLEVGVWALCPAIFAPWMLFTPGMAVYYIVSFTRYCRALEVRETLS